MIRLAGAFALIAVCLAAAPATAQDDRRIALVIGTEVYAHAPRAATATRDARAVGAALAESGYAVTLGLDPDRDGMRRLLSDFARRVPQAEIAAFYISGHALRSGGRSYLAASDARAGSLTDVLMDGVPLDLVLRIAAGAQAGAVVFVDGAQLAGFVPSDFAEPGLAAIEPVPGVAVVSAAAPGRAVRRGESRESRFARLVIDRFLIPDAPVMQVLRETRGDLWGIGTLPEGFALVPPPPPLAQDPVALQREIELAFWEAAERSGAPEDYEAYLGRYPRGDFADLARNRLARLEEARRDPDEASERALSLGREERAQVQGALALLGFDPRGVDGLFGPATRTAIAGWQQANGTRPSGFLRAEQHALLLGQAQEAERAERRRAEAQARAEAARDDAHWNATGARGDARGYRAYLDRYPEGRHARSAREGLERLAEARRDEAAQRDRALWRRAAQAATAEAYRDYLARYPDGLYAPEAARRLDGIEAAERQAARERALLRTEAALGLGPQDRQSVERRLALLGYGVGKRDGVFDGNTRRAIADYQAARRLPSTGYLDRRSLVTLLRETRRQGDERPGVAEVISRLLDALDGR